MKCFKCAKQMEMKQETINFKKYVCTCGAESTEFKDANMKSNWAGVWKKRVK